MESLGLGVLVPTDANPYEYYRRLCGQRPVHFHPQLGSWVLARHGDVRGAFADAATFTSTLGVAYEGSGPIPTILELDPPEHTVARRLVARRFSRRAAADLDHYTRELAACILARHTGPVIDAVADYAGLLPVPVAAAVLGLPADWHPALQRDVPVILAGGAEAAQATDRIAGLLGGWISSGQAAGSGGVIADLIATAGQASQFPELLTWTLVGLLGGVEPTATAVACVLLCLAGSPGHADVLRHGGPLSDGVLEEALRLHSPTQYMNRTVTSDVMIGGQLLRAHDRVTLLIASANRDPAVFGQPDAFRPGDGRPRSLAFGWGAHQCLGQWVARMIIKAAVTELYRRWPALSVQTAQTRWRYSGNVLVADRQPVDLTRCRS